jgi:uncharacterized protein YuzE
LNPPAKPFTTLSSTILSDAAWQGVNNSYRSQPDVISQRQIASSSTSSSMSPPARTEEVVQDVLIDYENKGRVVAIEFPGGVRELLIALLSNETQPHPRARSTRESTADYEPNPDK